MDQSVITIGRQPGGEPFDQPVVARHLPRVRQLPLPLPAGQLAGQVALRPAEPGQAHAGDIHLMNGREHLGEPLRELPRLVRRELLAVLLAAQHQAVHVLHQVERRADHFRVGAARDRSGHRDVSAAQRGQHPELPGHVVGGGQHVTERRPPQHQAGGTGFQAVGEVGPAAGDQFDAVKSLTAGYVVLAQPPGQPRTVRNTGNTVDRHAAEDTARDRNFHDRAPPPGATASSTVPFVRTIRFLGLVHDDVARGWPRPHIGATSGVDLASALT